MTDNTGYKAPCEKPHPFTPREPSVIYWGNSRPRGPMDGGICWYMACGASRANPVHNV